MGVKPIEQWAEETKGVSDLLDAFVTHAENSIAAELSELMEDEVEDFKRFCAISLRQFLEERT